MVQFRRVADKINSRSMCALLAFFAILPLVGILPQRIVATAVIAICLVLSADEDLYLVLPIMIFYYKPFGSLFGMSLYRWYTFIYIFSSTLKRLKKSGNVIGVIKWNKAVPLLVYYLFCVFALALKDLRQGLFAFFDVAFILIIVEDELRDDKKLKKFFAVWAVTSIFAYITGLVLAAEPLYEELLYEGQVIVERNKATFEDPNYMGFFYTIGAFAVAILQPFKKVPSIIMTIAIYIMLLSSMSVTAVIVNIILWMIYLFLTKKKFRKLVAGIIICAIVLYLYNMSLKNSDSANPLVQLAFRIEEKIDALLAGRNNDFTTGRLDLTKQHLDLFFRQPLWRKLVGMQPVCSIYRNTEMFSEVAHNEYVDWLHNIGIIGFAVMVVYVVISLLDTYTNYKRQKTDVNLFTVILKCSWILYAYTLTIFMDPRFLIPFFI